MNKMKITPERLGEFEDFLIGLSDGIDKVSFRFNITKQPIVNKTFVFKDIYEAISGTNEFTAPDKREKNENELKLQSKRLHIREIEPINVSVLCLGL